MHRAMSGFVCFAAVLLAATAVNAQQTVKVGVVMSFSGQFADPGAQIDNGIKLYMKQNGDTVAGKKIELIRKDSGGIAPDVAKRLSQEVIVREGAEILAGYDLTPNALAAADVSAQAKKFMVNMNAATSVITTKSPYMARTSFTVWAGQRRARQVGVPERSEKGLHAGFRFRPRARRRGGLHQGASRTPAAKSSARRAIRSPTSTSPRSCSGPRNPTRTSIYIWVPGGPQPASIGKAIAERGIDKSKVKIMGQGELTYEDALKSMGDAGLGLITAFHYDFNHQSAKNKAFVTAYNAEFKRNPDMFSVGGYDGMHLIYEALKKTGGKTDGNSLIAAAKGMKWESPRGPMMIDPETRDVVETVYIRRVEKVGGQLLNVEFDKIENVKDPWKERQPK